MPSISAWQRMNKALCCPWLASLLSCLRTGPVHQEISMLRPSQALPSYWRGRDRSTMQTKSSPTLYIIWRLKVRLWYRFYLFFNLVPLIIWVWQQSFLSWEGGRFKKGNARPLSASLSNISLKSSFRSWRPSVVAAQSRGQGGLRVATSLK